MKKKEKYKLEKCKGIEVFNTVGEFVLVGPGYKILSLLPVLQSKKHRPDCTENCIFSCTECTIVCTEDCTNSRKDCAPFCTIGCTMSCIKDCTGCMFCVEDCIRGCIDCVEFATKA
jgi:hypothetical protein